MDIKIVQRLDISLTVGELEVIKYALSEYLTFDEDVVLGEKYKKLAESMLAIIKDTHEC